MVIFKTKVGKSGVFTVTLNSDKEWNLQYSIREVFHLINKKYKLPKYHYRNADDVWDVAFALGYRSVKLYAEAKDKYDKQQENRTYKTFESWHKYIKSYKHETLTRINRTP